MRFGPFRYVVAMRASVRIDGDVSGLVAALDRRDVVVADDGAALLTDRMQPWRGPVIVVAQDPAAVTAALDDGAADAVVIGTPAEEIAARIAARLRMAQPPLGIGDLLIDRIARRVTRAGRLLRLLPREYALLDHLAAHAGTTVPRDALLLAVWGLGFDPGTNLVAVHISRLRAKLDREFETVLLHTEKGIGYRLAAA